MKLKLGSLFAGLLATVAAVALSAPGWAQEMPERLVFVSAGFDESNRTWDVSSSSIRSSPNSSDSASDSANWMLVISIVGVARTPKREKSTSCLIGSGSQFLRLRRWAS